MGTEKKAESSWEQPEQLGPYRIQEQVPQPTHSQGERYRATRKTSGSAVLLLLVLLNPETQPPNGADPLERAAPTPVSPEVLTAAEKPDPFVRGWLADGEPQRGPVLSWPLPREPFKGQKRPPCTRYVQVELVGACWMPHRLKAPCPDDLYEHQGECYAPVFSARPPPQSLGQ